MGLNESKSIGLSLEEIEAIRAVAAHFEDKSAASIEALKIVQKKCGWISDEHLKAIARLLGMSAHELDGVATFYNLIYRRPVGKKVIHYCDSVSCWMMGAEQVRESLSERLGIGLGETTPDGEYTLLPIVCLGACDRAPVVMVGEETHFNVDPDHVEELLTGHGKSASPEHDSTPAMPGFPHPGPITPHNPCAQPQAAPSRANRLSCRLVPEGEGEKGAARFRVKKEGEGDG